jgi:transcriptional regulator with XRE-family HTH domain
MAMLICDIEKEKSTDCIKKINEIQQEFRNIMIIFLGVKTPEQWVDLQMEIEEGPARLFLVENIKECASLIVQIHETMSNKHKFELQSNYIEQQKALLRNPVKIRETVKRLFEEMDVPSHEIDLIIHHHHTLKNIVLNSDDISKTENGEKLNISEATIRIIATFFETPKFEDKQEDGEDGERDELEHEKENQMEA